MMKRVTNVHEISPSLQSRLVNVALPTSFKMHILLSVFLLFLPNSASFGQVFAMVCFMFANDCVCVWILDPDVGHELYNPPWGLDWYYSSE